MASAHQTSFEPNAVPHPGETVLEYLEFQGWSQRDLARRTGLTPKTISEICSGKAPITPSTALVFEKAFQRPAHLWLNLQRHFDEAEARRREIARSSHWGEWVRHFPLKEMRRLNFSLPEGHSDTDVLLNFFGVSSPESWSSVWEASAVAYRQTRSFNAREESIAAWVRETEIVARGLDVDEFDEQRLLSFVRQTETVNSETCRRDHGSSSRDLRGCRCCRGLGAGVAEYGHQRMCEMADGEEGSCRPNASVQD